MKIYKFALPLLLIFIILISSSIACAEEISEDYSLNYGNDEFSIESSDVDDLDNSNINHEEPNEGDLIVEEDSPNNVKSNKILKSNEEYLEIDYPQTHDESHNIVVDAKPSGNKGKVGDEIKYQITVRNNNPFTVHYLEVFSPDDPDHFWLSKESLSKDIYAGFLDETAWLIEKLGPGETLVINAIIKIDQGGKSELSLSLSHNLPPYEYKTYEKTNNSLSNSNAKINHRETIHDNGINISNEKTGNPLALLFFSISSLFILNIRNRK